MAVRVRDVINTLVEPVEQINQTVDKLLYGNKNDLVTGIVTTFIMSHDVLKQAKSLGANFIVSHEGVCYSHHDDFKTLLTNDPVWQEKERFIHTSGMNIFRFHDYLHRYQPDGITQGLIESLSWESYIIEQELAYTVIHIPKMQMKDVAEYIKSKLGIEYVRVMGNDTMICQRIGILVGYRGNGDIAIPLFEKHSLDLMIYGEGHEWETPEYVRDALEQGGQKALIVLGHAESEEPGMAALKNRLKHIYPNIPVHHVSERPLFKIF